MKRGETMDEPGVASLLTTKAIEVKGRRVRYTDAGKGEPLLLIHGFPETLQAWRHNVPFFSAHFRVIAPDILGVGGSARPNIAYSPSELAEFLSDFLESLDIHRLHVLGTDTGQALAIAFAALFPAKTIKLVTTAGTIFFNDIKSWEIKAMCVKGLGELIFYNPFLGLVVRKALQKGFYANRSIRKDIYLEYLFSLKSSGGRRAALRMIRNLKANEPFLDDCLKRIQCPSLLVYADNDAFFPLTSGNRLAQMMNGAEFRVLQNCGHFMHEEKYQEFNAIVCSFLKGITN